MTERRKILIAEDEFLIRAFLQELFEDAGWAVTAAANGDEAAQMLTNYDAVITDVEMPGNLDGVALSWVVFERLPRVPVLIMSGGVLPRKATLPPNVHFIAKPAPPDVILRLVEDLANSR